MTEGKLSLVANRPSDHRRVFFDATLMLHHGLRSAVGLVRVEHYVAEYLLKSNEFEVVFIRFDHASKRFRVVDETELDLIGRILFDRYKKPECSSNEIERPGEVIERKPENYSSWLMQVCNLDHSSFVSTIAEDLGRRLPIKAEHSLLRRVSTRVLRRSSIAALRRAHSVLHGLGWLVRPDQSQGAPGMNETTQKAMASSRSCSSKSEPEFVAGDVLLSMGNMWDYMDYRYLFQLCREDGVSFVSVVYDVIAVELPFTPPGLPHIYHRHWVELGHCASRLVAISQHTRRTYQQYISNPNHLTVPISAAYLPNFLKANEENIGETRVHRLHGRKFVVYCSTIETRKNHQLLLHIWDRLRQELDADELPVLVFVGKWGWGTELVRLLVERNWRLSPYLQVMTEASDDELIWLYKNALFSVFPSHSEGFGLGAAESLSFGTPVVISNAPALVEATEGLMPAYDPMDFPAWLDEVRRLCTNSDHLHALRQKVREYRGANYEEFARAVMHALTEAGRL